MSSSSEKHAGYGWLLFCAGGMISSLTLYGIVLEYATSGGRKLHEISFIFVTTSIYALTAYLARGIFQEVPSKDISKYQMLIISLMSIASAYTSVRSLRYVIYPVQILFKSCKPVPVMIFGVLLGQRYSIRKYVNVIIITTGVALFMSGGSSSSGHSTSGTESTLMGALILSVSLCFDGATGAYEDRLMSGDHRVGPFDLMFNIQLGKSIISFCALIVLNGVNKFVHTVQDGGLALVLLGLTGALGQVFLFITISKFGALNCALLGLLRKMLSLLLSFLLYGHTLNAVQTVGLVLAVAAMAANFVGKGDSSSHGTSNTHDKTDDDSVELHNLTSGEVAEDEEDSEETPLILQTLGACNRSLDAEAGQRPITVTDVANLVDTPLLEFEKSPLPAIVIKTTKGSVDNITSINSSLNSVRSI